VAVARGPPQTAIQYVIYFRYFVDDVTFLHIGANGPESKTMRMFRPFR